MCLKLGFQHNQSQVQGDFSQRAKTPRRLLNLDVFGSFPMGKRRFPRGSFFKTFGRLQKESAGELACTSEGIFALVAVPEDILLQLAEELRVLIIYKCIAERPT